MSNQSLQESISALMDNEADELEIRRVLQASESDPALRSTWDRYQMARSIMHKEPWQPKVDLSAGISALIADEAVPVAVESQVAACMAEPEPSRCGSVGDLGGTGGREHVQSGRVASRVWYGR